MKKKFLSLLIAGGLSCSMVLGSNPTVAYAIDIDAIQTGSDIVEKFVLPAIMTEINRAEAINGEAKEHLTYMPTKFEKGKFYITAFDYDKPTAQDEIYIIKIYNKLNYDKVSEIRLKSGQEIGIDVSNTLNEYIMEVSTIFDSTDIRKLASVNLSQEEVRNGQRGIALSKVGNAVSRFYWLSPETTEKYNEKLLEKYTNYNMGNVPIYESNLSWQRIKYNQLDENNENEKLYRYLCKTKTVATKGEDLVNAEYFKVSENSNTLEKWSNGQEDILYKEPQFSNDKFEITAFDYSKSKNTTFEIRSIDPRNPLNIEKYELKNGESINMLDKLGDYGSLIEIYEKNKENSNETFVDRYFLSKENVQNCGIGISKGEDKAVLFYLKKHESSNKNITTEVLNKADISRTGYVDNNELQERLNYWVKHAPKESVTFLRPNFQKGMFSVSAFNYCTNDVFTSEFKVVAYPKNDMNNTKTYTLKFNEVLDIPVGEDESEYVFKFYENRDQYEFIGQYYLNKDNKKEGIGIALSRRNRLEKFDDLEKVNDMSTKMLYVKKGEDNSISLLKRMDVLAENFRDNAQIDSLLNKWKEENPNNQVPYKIPDFSKGKLNLISYDDVRKDGESIGFRIITPNNPSNTMFYRLPQDLIERLQRYSDDTIVEFIDLNSSNYCGVLGRIQISKDSIGENMYGISLYRDLNGNISINYLQNKDGKIETIDPLEIPGNKSQQELESIVTNWRERP